MILLAVSLSLVFPGGRMESQEAKYPDLAASAISALLNGLDDPDRGVRFAAAQGLGKCGEPAVIPALARALKDPEWCVREVAAHSLHSFGEESAPIFAESLRSDDPGRRLSALKAFVRRGESGLAFVRQALSDPDERIRFFAVRTIRDESVVPVLRGLLAAKDTSIGIEAARMLTDLGYGEDAVEALLTGVREYRGVNRTEVAGILKRTGACGAEEANALVEILIGTKESNNRLRSGIEEVLVSIGEPAEKAVENYRRRCR